MELASLTRPAIQCQCLRCSSSLAVLENEWARLSNSYSIATAWLSVNLHRISISSERKQIPQTSDMDLLRGRIIQELSCKLCQQKLGVLCTLDNGPNVLWKMSKVSFRDVVTMRTAEPIYNDSSLERLGPTPKESLRRDPNSPDGALVPASNSALALSNPSVQQQMQHQGRSIDQISNSVNHLQDTMTDLKLSFNALRIELNGPSRNMGQNGAINGPGFDMIATVLKELKLKSEEIEKLKLEIETLKFKNRFMEERKPNNTGPSMGTDGALPEVKSPDLLQAGRKRAWPDAFANGRSQPATASFVEEDMVDDLSLEDLPTYSVRVPARNPQTVADSTGTEHSSPASPQLRIEVGEQPSELTTNGQRDASSQPAQSPAKRLRLTQQSEEWPKSDTNPAKKRQGRPRKSLSQSAKPNPPQNTGTAATNSEDPTGSNPPIQVPISTSSPTGPPSRRGRPRRSTRSQSMGPSELQGQPDSGNSEQSTQEATENTAANSQQNGGVSSKTTNGDHANGTNGVDSPAAVEEKRKAKVAARDVMTRMAMQREEAMETDEGR
ncbi:uncharacterized protein N7459_002368 [Penicillium hispanicum]|uniref:uncharacterized protein n=1 Tax=Penicillium hispanicum TaxID=1080232 RepID=UPI002540F5FE|nr:uncharacterized protein N7459_002368 [Penicillium hispanicum]KAJ5591999.1 hypothetical protein N7459_002368 [Penicillium hispanicum]